MQTGFASLLFTLAATATTPNRAQHRPQVIQEKHYRIPAGTVESVDCGGVLGIIDVQPNAGSLSVPATVFMTVSRSTLPVTVTAATKWTWQDKRGPHEQVTSSPVAVRVVGGSGEHGDSYSYAVLALSVTQPKTVGFSLVAHPAHCRPKRFAAEWDECNQVIANFGIASKRAPAVIAASKVLGGEAISDAPCAGRSLMLDVSPVAPAYEINFAASEAALRAGKGRHSVLLNSTPDRKPPSARIALNASNFPMPQFGDYVLTVTALFADRARAEASPLLQIRSAKR